MAERDERGRWVPGVSGNPNGKPKGTRALVQDLYRVLAEIPMGDELEAMYEQLDIPHGVRDEIAMAGDRQEAFARALVFRMMIGNWTATEQIFGRLEPKPIANTISGPGGGPIQTAGVQLAGNDPNAAQAAYLALVRGEEDPDDDAGF
jgi:hypothetical protein